MLKIAVTTGSGVDWAWEPYASAIERSGGAPVLVGKLYDGKLDDCRGMLATGGNDIHPALYGRMPEDEALSDEEVIAKYGMQLDTPRDDYELPLIREAIRRKIPILGICRGIQSVNVLMGGRLIPDIPKCIGGRIIHGKGSHHEVELDSNSIFAKLLGIDRLRVNSYHHQGLTQAELAPGLTPVGFAADGMIEAVISSDPSHWLLAVQWHPERWKDAEVYESCKGLFDGLIRAVEIFHPVGNK